MSLTVKAYYGEEIRRFCVDVSNASSFDYLEGKVRNSFPNLPAKGNLLIKWKDGDGDMVTFSTDEELVEALSSSENGVFKIYLLKRNGGNCNQNSTDGSHAAPVWTPNDIFVGLHGMPPPPPMPPMPFGPHAWPRFEEPDGTQKEAVHLAITCDGCDASPITGIRFKCQTCADFDLCSTCKSKGIHSDHPFKEIAQSSNGCPRFWMGRGGLGPRKFGRGRGKFHGCRGPRMDADNSGPEDAKCKPSGGCGPLTKEERDKMQAVAETVKEAAKTQAFEIGGAVAGDCAGESVLIAVRSSIRRALIVQKRSGLGPKVAKKKRSKRDESSSSSDDTEGEEECLIEETETSSGNVKKMPKRQIKMAAKSVAKIAHKEVTESFGKLAGNWAAQAVRQSVMMSIKHCLKGKLKMEKKLAKKNEVSEKVAAETEMDVADAGSEMDPISVSSPGYPPLSLKINNVPIYPQIVERVPVYAGPAEKEATVQPVPTPANPISSDEQTILDAIAAFQNMGFTPDERLVTEIRNAKGDITVVFENMKGK